MYQAARKVHRWIGLILFIFIFIEAITGLILAEPWLVGQKERQMPSRGSQLNLEQNVGAEVKDSAPPSAIQPQSGFNVYRLAKELHQGKVAGLDLKWLVDLLALGLVILALTGVYISIPSLRRRRKKG